MLFPEGKERIMSQRLLLIMATAAAAIPPAISVVPKAIPSLVSGTGAGAPAAASAPANYTPPPYVTPISYTSSSTSTSSVSPDGKRYSVGYAPGESSPAGTTNSGAGAKPRGWASGDDTTKLVSQSVSAAGQPINSSSGYVSTPLPQTFASASPAGTVGPGQVISNGQIVRQYAPNAPMSTYPPAPVGFEQYFRFDITPEWVSSQWDFVTACIGPVYTQGYRVSLVTGTAEDDLTGVLTYYFDSDRKVHKIVFQGTTGNLDRLTATLNHRFQMGQRKVNDPSLIVYETPPSLFNQKNYMEARKPLILQTEQKYHRYEVYLTLNRPKEQTGLFW